MCTIARLSLIHIFIEACKPIAEENGCTIKLTSDVKDACTGAHVIYTDVWAVSYTHLDVYKRQSLT